MCFGFFGARALRLPTRRAPGAAAHAEQGKVARDSRGVFVTLIAIVLSCLSSIDVLKP